MSLAFVPSHMRGNPPDHQATVQKLLDENSRLIDVITEYQNQGRAEDAGKHQMLLHRNLVHLANLADQSLLPQLREEKPNDPLNGSNGSPSNPATFQPPPTQNSQYPGHPDAYQQQYAQQMGQQRPSQQQPMSQYPQYGQGGPRTFSGPPQGYDAQRQPRQQLGYPPQDQQQFMQ
ncbi:unnamed protein product [Caenorhabditis auriculariae]|uniref:SS18 N-terminal domain-containing protein n=1 Tax=Caenorhabditis auriculariae TaxID=2777116 RepID=A0A8S1GYE4_9PELO|nr:unnamed protein product [Caenorhabditis auriculariae]